MGKNSEYHIRVTVRRNTQISEEERLDSINRAARILMRGYLRFMKEKDVDSKGNI